MCLELLRVGVGSRVKRGTKHGVDVADRQAPVPGVPPVANGVLGGAQPKDPTVEGDGDLAHPPHGGI